MSTVCLMRKLMNNSSTWIDTCYRKDTTVGYNCNYVGCIKRIFSRENSLVVNRCNTLSKYLPSWKWLVLVVSMISLNLEMFKNSLWIFRSLCALAGLAFCGFID